MNEELVKELKNLKLKVEIMSGILKHFFESYEYPCGETFNESCRLGSCYDYDDCSKIAQIQSKLKML